MNKLLYFIFFLVVVCISLKGQESKATNLVESTIEELHLEILKEPVDLDISLYAASPNNPEETIVVIPETVNEEEDFYELNSHIFIVDNVTGKVTNRYFESSKTNGWTSDAIFIDNIEIDTTVYKLAPSKNAFGVIVTWRSMSQPNPYRQESISLYAREKDSLTKVLDLYTIYESSGEINVNGCYAKYEKTVKELAVSDLITENYFEILVNTTISEEVFQEDKNGECNPKEKVIATEKEVLKFNRGAYSKAESLSKQPHIKQATIDSVSVKEVKFPNEHRLATIYDYYKKEEIDEVEIWSNKMFGRCCSEADLDYSELFELDITAKTTNVKYPSYHLSDKVYRSAYVFRAHDDIEIGIKLNFDEEAHKYHTNLSISEVLKTNDTLLKPFKLSIVNGYVKSEKTFQENGRVKELQVFLNGIDQGTVTLLDTPLIQQFEMDFSFFKNDEVTLVPISFYNGTKYDDICISEIQSSLSKITHPSINKKYKVQELWKKGYALKKNKQPRGKPK